MGSFTIMARDVRDTRKVGDATPTTAVTTKGPRPFPFALRDILCIHQRQPRPRHRKRFHLGMWCSSSFLRSEDWAVVVAVVVAPVGLSVRKQMT